MNISYRPAGLAIASLATIASAPAIAQQLPEGSDASILSAWHETLELDFSLVFGGHSPRDGDETAVDPAFDLLATADLNLGMFQDQAMETAAASDTINKHAGKSDADVAAELANPNSDLAQLKFRNQFRLYTGDLPNADDQWNYTMLFQPIFPFSLGETASGNKLTFFLRPAIPLLVEQPVFNAGTLDFNNKTGLGDIGFDAALGMSTKDGWQLAFGMDGMLPTATDGALGGGQLRLGPECLIAKQGKFANDMGYFLGVFPSHLWDVGGWQDGAFSTTNIQPLAVLLLGDGWAVASEPIMSYDWIADQWTIPLNIQISRTVTLGNTPLKIELEFNYYVEQSDAFGPQWMIALNLTPVVSNFLEAMFGG